MMTRYHVEIDNQTIVNRLKGLTNQIYKLLPNREEGIDWQKPLANLTEEIAGMYHVLNKDDIIFPLLCKLEGLKLLIQKEDFMLYRSTIFECLGLMRRVIENVESR